MNIYKRILEHTKSDIYPFHMPGHKRNKEFLCFDENILDIDITEIFGMDNLQNPSGMILETEKRAADIFGSDRSFLLANGATGGVISAILAQASTTGHIIIGRNSHMSAYSAIILGRLNPIYIYPDISVDKVSGPINPMDIKITLEKNPEAKTVFITSPTYEGIVSNISKIAEIVHQYNATLIVDEAHGSHFGLHEAFPKSALQSGADIVINSLHKTLPSLTQTAIIHTKGKRVNQRLLRMYLNMINSSSPSYILLSSIDKCIDFLENRCICFENYVENLCYFYENIERTNFRYINNDYLRINFNFSDEYKAYDISKIVIMTDGVENIDNILRKDFAIEIEVKTDNFIIAMTSPADTKEGFTRLSDALFHLSHLTKRPNTGTHKTYPKAKTLLKPNEAIDTGSQQLAISEAQSYVSAEFIAPYPPGIPLVIPGEVISCEIINSLPKSYRHKNIYVVQV